MRCDHEQIAAPGPASRLPGGLPGPPRAPAPVQPPEVHPAPAPRLPGAQGVRAPRLPRTRSASGRPPRPPRADRPEGRPPLHHLPEGRRPAPQGGPGPTAVRRRTRRGAEGQGPQAAGAPGGGGWHRAGEPPRQPVLRQAPGQDRDRDAGHDVLPVPEGCAGQRLPHPPGAGGGPRPGPRLGPGAVQSGAEAGRRPRPDRDVAGRRRLRRRMGARARPVLRHPYADPAGARAAVGEPAGREVAAADEAAVQQEEVWSAVAGGDGQFDDQTAGRLGAAGAELLESVPRDHPPGHHT
jgi:hypothetical protein